MPTVGNSAVGILHKRVRSKVIDQYEKRIPNR